MQLKVEGKQIDVGESLRTHVTDHLTDAVNKYFEKPIDGTVVFSREGSHSFKADVSLHVGKGIMLQSSHTADDPYPAFDGATDRVAKRMRRYKKKMKDHHNRIDALDDTVLQQAKYYTINDDSAEEEEPADEPMIVAEIDHTIYEMSVSEAVMRMNLADVPCFMFENSKTGQINVVYRRQDGHIGWIDPKNKS